MANIDQGEIVVLYIFSDRLLTKDISRPLSKPMSVLELTALLTELAALMQACDVKIARNGKIVEKYPGALSKVANA